jgi:PKD repeat protein
LRGQAPSDPAAEQIALFVNLGCPGGRPTRDRFSDLNEPPIAAFTYNCTKLTCTFNGSASSDPDGYISYYSWSFGDNREGSGPVITHTYAAAGTYVVKLSVMDSVGKWSSHRQTINVKK